MFYTNIYALWMKSDVIAYSRRSITMKYKRIKLCEQKQLIRMHVFLQDLNIFRPTGTQAFLLSDLSSIVKAWLMGWQSKVIV